MKYDLEPREIFYNRTGNLSQATALDKKLAEQFMRVSDLRLDVVITDSDKKPEQSTVAVGSDVLAWRTVVPLNELTKIVLRPKRYRQTKIADARYIIQIHDQVIDDDIRKLGYKDREDYDKQYLARLKTEVKGGLAEALCWEKLGLRAQSPNWRVYIISAMGSSLLLYDGSLQGVIMLIGTNILVIHPAYNFVWNKLAERHQQISNLLGRHGVNVQFPLPPFINPRDWKHAFMPVVPVDKYYKGRRFLAQHGEELIIARN